MLTTRGETGKRRDWSEETECGFPNRARFAPQMAIADGHFRNPLTPRPKINTRPSGDMMVIASERLRYSRNFPNEVGTGSCRVNKNRAFTSLGKR
jgi:hypothetical protein